MRAILAWMLPVWLRHRRGDPLPHPAWGQSVYAPGIAPHNPYGEKMAENVFAWARGTSFIRLDPVEGEEHVAEVMFQNGAVHSDLVETESLSIPGLSISFTADVGHGARPDFIDITVPDGFVAVPVSISVTENQSGKVLIYKIENAEAM
jgi:hypothetical protein